MGGVTIIGRSRTAAPPSMRRTGGGWGGVDIERGRGRGRGRPPSMPPEGPAHHLTTEDDTEGRRCYAIVRAKRSQFDVGVVV